MVPQSILVKSQHFWRTEIIIPGAARERQDAESQATQLVEMNTSGPSCLCTPSSTHVQPRTHARQHSISRGWNWGKEGQECSSSWTQTCWRGAARGIRVTGTQRVMLRGREFGGEEETCWGSQNLGHSGLSYTLEWGSEVWRKGGVRSRTNDKPVCFLLDSLWPSCCRRRRHM